LARSLALVHGQPFSGTDPRRYGWADCLKQQMIDTIAEVAHELATRQLAAGDLGGARAAALKGLIAEPGSELLLRDQILALAAGKNITAIKEISERITRRNNRLGVETEPETSALLDRYLGGHRPNRT
ncbi:MAG: rane protein, partial [Streptosporangiaceae bacterium]|nr:rane protein [Streptosporangiaceae bacterium]